MASISDLAASLTSAIEKEAKDLEEKKAQLEKEREQLADERRRMSQYAAIANDPVKINVGGKVFQTQRSTLLSAQGSLLEAIFSGRWEDNLCRDDMGHVFFDFDPAPFRAVLNYLRSRSLAEPGQAIPPPQVPPEHRGQFETMVSFLWLKDIIYGGSAAPSGEAMLCHQAGCRDGGLVVKGGKLQSSKSAHRCAVGGEALLCAPLQERCAWKVSISQNSDYVLAGVTGNPAPPDGSHSDAGTYAWDTAGAVWTGGSQGANGGWPGWRAGDVAIFQLDASERLLRMRLQRTSTVYALTLPPNLARSARLHFNLRGSGTELEVSQPSAKELQEAGF